MWAVHVAPLADLSSREPSDAVPNRNRRPAGRFSDNSYNRTPAPPTTEVAFASMNGFLHTRASIMMDVVVVTMVLIIPILWGSVWLARSKRRFSLHRNVQTVLAIVLLLAVIGFEVDVRMNGWEHRAAASRFWGGPEWNDLVHYSLLVHLLFAMPTPFLWGFVIVRARRKFPAPPVPAEHSRQHRFWGRVAAIYMTLTAVTGWAFYWFAFVA